MTTDCTREQDVMAAVLAGRWPGACPGELRAHVESCAVCGEIASIAAALREQMHLAEVTVPAAGQIWWRAAIHARAEAARAAARPMIWLQAITGAITTGIALGILSMVWPRIASVARELLPFTAVSLPEALPLLLTVGLALVAAPIAFYLAVPRD